MLLADENAGELSGTDEVVAIIFSFLPPVEIMCLRRVCTTWRDAVKKTLVPMTEFDFNSVRKYNAMRVMSTALPNLQLLAIRNLGQGHKYIPMARIQMRSGLDILLTGLHTISISYPTSASCAAWTFGMRL
jgi:hypothetical protein